LEYQRVLCDESERSENGFNYVQSGYLSDFHRSTLVNWLFQLGEEFQFTPETNHLCIIIMDRFIARNCKMTKGQKIPTAQLQLIASGAMLLASKQNERYPAAVSDLIDACDNQYEESNFKKVQTEIFKILKWNINYPVSYSFTRYVAHYAFRNEPKSQFLRKLTLLRFICEISLLDSKYITVSQSKIVAASLLVILKLRKAGLLKSEQVVCNQWTPGLEYLTSYDEKAIRKLADLIHNTLREVARVSTTPRNVMCSQNSIQQKNKFSPIIEKYAENNFFSVSKMIVQFYRDHFLVN